MLFLKAVLLFLLNCVLGYVVVLPVKVFLFYPKKEKHFRGRKIPFTPGFLRRKKDWLFTKVRHLLHSYLAQAEDAERKNGFLADWENKAAKTAWDKLDFIIHWKYVPLGIKERIRYVASRVVAELVGQFLRDFIPFLIGKLQIDSKIDYLDEKADLEKILYYFEKYFFKYLTYVSIILWGIAGIFNMILFMLLA